MSETIRASHILLMYAGSMRSTATRSKDEAQTQMNGLLEQITAGGSFADLAKENSDCPSGQSGGDLGPFGPGQMVPAFDTAAFGLEPGQTSGVIETDFGYHIIHRTE